MPFSKKTWEDRIVQYPNRFNQTLIIGSTYDLIPEPGTITQAGTPISAAELNRIESGIEEATEIAETHSHSVATASENGLMSSNDKAKVDKIINSMHLYHGAYYYNPKLTGSGITWSGQLYTKGTYLVNVHARYNSDANHTATGTWLVKYDGGTTNKIGSCELLGTVSKCGYASSLSLSVNLDGLITVTFTATLSSTTDIHVTATKIANI
jgi:hypothetical protein